LRISLHHALIFLSLCLLIIDFTTWPLVLCVGVSATALTALDKLRVSRDERSALADMVMLAPVVFIALRSLR
jgi:hypothetical protein